MDVKEQAMHLRNGTRPLDRPELHCYATDTLTGRRVWLMDRLEGGHWGWWVCMMDDEYTIRRGVELTDFRQEYTVRGRN